MNKINGIIQDALHNKTAKQTFVLFGSRILVTGIGIIAVTLVTRILGPKDYGILAFFGVITGFIVLFFRFGFFSSIGLLLAQEKNKIKERELIGASILIGLLIGFSYSLFIFISSFFVDDIFKTNINYILRIFSPIIFILSFQMLVPQIGRGINKISYLSYFYIVPKSLYLIGIILMLLLGFIQIKVSTLILLNLVVLSATIIIINYNLKPLFTNFKKNLKKIWRKNKEYGIHLYWGQIADQSTYKLDGIFISYFVNITQLGFYSLAEAITRPMVILSHSLSTSLFKDFTKKERIPKRIIYYNFLWLSFCVLGLTLLGKFIVTLFFTDKFLPIVPLILPLALAGFFQGMYQPYGMFSESKGRGKLVKKASIASGFTNLIGNFILVPLFGIMGAAIATLLGRLVHLSVYLFYYYFTNPEKPKINSEKSIFKKWVKQPPATPLVQYLRDAEKINSWRFLKGKEMVLDIANESNVTFGINAKYIARIDASLEASNFAKEVLRNKVINNFTVFNPLNPILPFPKNNFDAVISIGPYDWLFLDIYKLTNEVHRVIKKNGIFVFSVPTIKSAYRTRQSKHKFRYYTIDELMHLIDNPNWHLKDFVLIYQPPKIVYPISSLFIPWNFQKPIIKICWQMTRFYTHKKLWNKASYIIVALEKK